jgi:hypothetical protein
MENRLDPKETWEARAIEWQIVADAKQRGMLVKASE